MVKCTNTECPIRERCKRFMAKDIPRVQEKNKFEYQVRKNKDGVVVGYTCQFQIFL